MWKVVSPEGSGPVPRGGMTMTVVNELKEGEGLRVVMFGGADRSQKLFNDVWVYNLLSNSWTRPKVRGSPPAKRSGHSAVNFGGKVYIFGGQDMSSGVIFGDLYALDVGSEDFQWTKPAASGSMPLARSSHAATLVNKSMVVMGGCGDEAVLIHPQILDLETMRWSAVIDSTSGIIGREMTSLSLVGDKLFLVGGRSERGVENEVIVFDAVSLKLLGGDVCPHPRCGHVACVVAETIILFGGTDLVSPPAFSDTLCYDTKTKTWMQTRMLREGGGESASDETTASGQVAERFAHAGFCVGSQFFVFGGVNFEKDLGDICRLDVDSLPKEIVE